MKEIVINMVLIIFPILMYLAFTCYNVIINQKISKLIFIITIFTSLYLCLKFNQSKELLIFCNLPIIICYYKKENLLAIILSTITIIYCYYYYDTNIIITILKYLSYLILYFILHKLSQFIPRKT